MLNPVMRALLVVASLFVSPGDAIAQVRVGAMGDSITDEWSNLDPSGNTFGYSTTGVRNWVEFAEFGGKLDFGSYTVFDLVSGTQEIRRAGVDRASYSWNFARGGASTEANGLNAFNTFFSRSFTQSPALLPPGTPQNFQTMADAATVDFGVLMLGGNDFLAGINIFTYWKDLPPTDPANATRLDNMIANLAGGLQQATDSGNAPIKMVLGNLFDVGDALTTAGGVFTAQQRDNIRDNVQAWNARVDNLAATLFAEPMPVVSLWDWWEEAATGQTTVHGISIQAQAASGSAIGADKSVDLTAWNNLVLPDGVHPAPVGAALLANRVVEALMIGYGESGVTPFTSKELVMLTGLDPQVEPVADAGSSYTIAEFGSLALDASGSSDPNVGDNPFLTFAWEVNGDADFADAVGEMPLLSWPQLVELGFVGPGAGMIELLVDDTFGGMNAAMTTLTIEATIDGDGNGDRTVEAADYTIWADLFGQTGLALQGDFNRDMIVAAADYTIWANNFGQSALSPNASFPGGIRVPEPSSLPMLVLGIVLLGAVAPRRRRTSLGLGRSRGCGADN